MARSDDGGFEEYLIGALEDYLDSQLHGEGIMGCPGSTQKVDDGVWIAMDDGRTYKVTLEREDIDNEPETHHQPCIIDSDNRPVYLP